MLTHHLVRGLGEEAVRRRQQRPRRSCEHQRQKSVDKNGTDKRIRVRQLSYDDCSLKLDCFTPKKKP